MPNPFPDESEAQRHIGYAITTDPVRVTLTVGPRHRNRFGALHGGIIATLLDTASGMTCAMAAATDPAHPPRFMTVSLTVNFLATAEDGAVTARAQITGGGRKINFVESVLEDANGATIARASAVMKKLSD